MKISHGMLICALAIFCIAGAHINASAQNYEENQVMSSITAVDVCEMGPIYDEAAGYKYSLPQSVLEGFLSGKAFDHPKVYSADESVRLHDDINEIYQAILARGPEKDNLAVMTAGAPGSGKTFMMRQILAESRSVGTDYAYVCPDDVCLKSQSRTYGADIVSSGDSKEARLAAYNKWRPGSNAATHLILGNLIREKFAFYFGTTSTGPATGKFFDFLKKQGYQIKLIHISAPDDVRWASIQERDKTFIQTTETDVCEKGLLLPQRIMDTYLAYADAIDFYYRDGVHADAELSAIWTRNIDCTEALGTLQIVSSPKYEQIKAIHNAATEVLFRPELQWELTVEKNSKILVMN